MENWIKSINFKISAFENRGAVCSLKSEKKIILMGNSTDVAQDNQK